MTTKRRKGGRIDWANEPQHVLAVALGADGFSARTIAEFTGLSPCQVGYRMKCADLRIRDYREAKSEYAKRVANRQRADSYRFAERQLKQRGIRALGAR